MTDYDNIARNDSTFEKQTNDDFRIKMVRRMIDPSYLPTILMPELYENVYSKSPPIINGLLYPGTYSFVGAPKVGKSFFMLQLAYHISTGTPLWEYLVRKGTVLYLALEDSYHRLQERLYRMFGTDCAPDLHLNVSAARLLNEYKIVYRRGQRNGEKRPLELHKVAEEIKS